MEKSALKSYNIVGKFGVLGGFLTRNIVLYVQNECLDILENLQFSFITKAFI